VIVSSLYMAGKDEDNGKGKEEEEDVDEEEVETDQNEATEKSEKKKKKKKKKKKGTKKEKTAEELLEEDLLQHVDGFIETVRSDKWKLEKKKQGVIISRQIDPSSPIHKIKGETVVEPCTVNEMADFLREFEAYMPVADHMYDRGSVLKLIGKDVQVLHATFRLPGRPLLSDRDFVWVGLDKLIDNNGKLGVSFGYTKDVSDLGIEVAEQSGVVRATILESGYLYTAVEGNDKAVNLSYIVQADAKGWIPTWAANLVAADQALNVARIRKHFEKKAGRKTDEDGEDAATEQEKVDKLEAEKASKGNVGENKKDNAEDSSSSEKKKKKKKKQAKAEEADREAEEPEDDQE